MVSSLSNLVDNLAERIHIVKFKYGHNEYTEVKDDLIDYKYLCCNKNYKEKFL